ncbi:7-carboxy-7-deazaguanine synthase QueE [Rossellomorea vietnamensis]|uniref:7-carboxy-7-deazaguanine synthase n=1 Tax=Rossellomorea vietnamensis TaxID=218284 RepID=A0A5D4KAB1_9BACI|nr:7-carboxy-7-deazaguanine synthase QueE [Rossellomorea vietnamensis]TYR74092.1 7-carboxy-7-deazaguanine synthase QueE [Rossellomorea vietnamensis]
MRKIPVLEVFGPTIQGEGMVIGQKTMFVRTAGCDYSCSWCDSAFTWDGSAKEDIRLLTAAEIWQELHEIGGRRFNHVTISGGNPALITAIEELLDVFKKNGISSALETQGSRWQDWFMDIDELTLSPKPPSSGMKTDFDKLDYIIERLKNHTSRSLKVVIFNAADLEYAANLHERYPGVPFFLQVGNGNLAAEEGEGFLSQLITDYENLIDAVTDSERLNDVRVLPQLHTYVWGNKRGV